MIGDIHIYVFIDPSNQTANNIAQDVWFQTQHQQAGGIFVFVKGEQGAAEMASRLRASYPTIVFMREEGNNNFLSLGRITGNTSFPAVQQKYLNYLNNSASNTGSPIGEGTSNSVVYGEGDQFGLGLGLANIKIPTWVWVALGAAALYKLNDK